MYFNFANMGLGPWYRIGLSMPNAVILVAIVETIVTCNTASHSLAFALAKYHYGMHDGPIDNLVEEHPQWVLFGIVLLFQIIADVFLWVVVIVKGNRHFGLLWVMAVIVKTSYTAVLHTFTKDEWDRTYEALEALEKITAFLWGTFVFGFSVITGIQVTYCLSTEEGRVKVSPLGQGVLALRDYYRENLVQLAVVLLLSEAISNIHRCFNYPVTAYLEEAHLYLGYDSPDEMGIKISIATIVINAFGLILLVIKHPGSQKAWVAVYVILILVHLLLLAYIGLAWSAVNVHPHMFNGFVFISLAHLCYKIGVFYIYYKSIGQDGGGGGGSSTASSPRNEREAVELDEP